MRRRQGIISAWRRLCIGGAIAPRRCQLDDLSGRHHFRAQNSPVRRPIFPEQYEAANLTYRETEMILRVDPMNILPVDRALSLYGTLADRSETKGARERLSRHLMQLYIGGEKDEHCLTVHGLLYLCDLDRAIDSRN